MKILLIDIETAPHLALIWGPKTNWISPDHVQQSGYTLCFAAKWLGAEKVIFKSVFHHTAEVMIQSAWDLLHEADAVIHYNGTQFDLPTLHSDFIERGMTPPSPAHDIDLLKTSRQRFRRYSHRLDAVAKWLGLGAKTEHKGMPLWIGCMNNNRKDWATMRTYNINDVLLLERVYEAFLPWIKSHPNHALYTDSDRPICGNCGGTRLSRQGIKTTATQAYQQYKCLSCGKWQRQRANSTPPETKRNILVSA